MERSLGDRADRWQEDLLALLTTDWSDKKRRGVRESMADLMERSSAMDA